MISKGVNMILILLQEDTCLQVKSKQYGPLEKPYMASKYERKRDGMLSWKLANKWIEKPTRIIPSCHLSSEEHMLT